MRSEAEPRPRFPRTEACTAIHSRFDQLHDNALPPRTGRYFISPDGERVAVLYTSPLEERYRPRQDEVHLNVAFARPGWAEKRGGWVPALRQVAHYLVFAPTKDWDPAYLAVRETPESAARREFHPHRPSAAAPRFAKPTLVELQNLAMDLHALQPLTLDEVRGIETEISRLARWR